MFENIAARDLIAAQATLKVLSEENHVLRSENETLRRDLAVANTKLTLQAENAELRGKLAATLFQVSLREALNEQRLFAKVAADDRDQELVQRTMGHLVPLLAGTNNGEPRVFTGYEENKS